MARIGDEVFSYCTGLESIIVPHSVVSVGDSAFSKCTHINDVYYTGTEDEWAEIVIEGNNEALLNATIHYNYVLKK